MMKRKGFRSFVAVLALVSMLLENTATVFAVEAANGNTEQVQETVAETVSESSEESTEAQAEPEEAPAEEQTQEPASEQAEEPEEAPSEEASQPEENPVGEEGSIEPEVTVSVDEPSYDNEEVVSEETAAEEAPEIDVPDTINISGDRIEAAGYEDLYIAVNTDQMNDRDTFRIRIDGMSGEAVCDAKLYGTLSKSDASIYKLERLGQSSLTISATDLSEGMTVEYLTRDDGYPQINLISEPEPEVEKILKVADDGKSLEGSGYENISVSFNTAELKKDVTFSLVPGTSAEVRYNGEPVEGAIKGLSRNAGTIQLSNLNNQSFVLYIVGDETNTIAADYTISSVENGAVIIKVYDSGKEQTVKRVYEFEDDDVKVTATIEKAEAVPDDAYFHVEKIETSSDIFSSYMELLNQDAGEEEKYHRDNTLLYDIAFFTDDTMTEEIEPEEGSVNVAIQFKKDQLTDEIGVLENNEIEVTHFKDTGEDVELEKVDAESSIETGEVQFSTESFSLWALSEQGTYTFSIVQSGWGIEGELKIKIKKSDLDSLGVTWVGEQEHDYDYYFRFGENGAYRTGCQDKDGKALGDAVYDLFGVSYNDDGSSYANVLKYLYGFSLIASETNDQNEYQYVDLSNISFDVEYTFYDNLLSSTLGITNESELGIAQLYLAPTYYTAQGYKQKPQNKDANGYSQITRATKNISMSLSDGTTGSYDKLSFTSDGAMDFLFVKSNKPLSTGAAETEQTVSDPDHTVTSVVQYGNSYLTYDPQKVDAALNHKTLLGDAWYYGITAEQWKLAGDAETNFAVKDFIFADDENDSESGTQTGANTSKTGIEDLTQPILAGTVSGNPLIKGFPAVITTPQAYQSLFTHESADSLSFVTDSKQNIYNAVDDMIAYVQGQSDALAAKDSFVDYNVRYTSNGVNLELDFRKSKSGKDNNAGTYYIDVEKYEDLFNLLAASNGTVDILKNPDQVIVFNYPTDSEVELFKFTVNGADSADIANDPTTGSSGGTYAEQIIFNAPDATHVTMTGGMGATFLFPKAVVDYYATCGGWIVCKKITTTSGEWHFTNGKLTEIPKKHPATGEFKVSKSLVTSTGEDAGWIEDSEYTFILEGNGSAPMPVNQAETASTEAAANEGQTTEDETSEGTEGSTAGGETTAAESGSGKTISVDEKAVAKSFGEITFPCPNPGEEANYTYYIREGELSSSLVGLVSRDTTIYKITAKVVPEAIDGDSNNLRASVTYKLTKIDSEGKEMTSEDFDISSPVEFKNPVTQEASVTLRIDKYLIGADWPTGNFRFNLSEMKDDRYADETGIGTVPIPVSVDEEGGSQGTAYYSLKYEAKDAGTHYYLLREVDSEYNDINYDATVYKLKVIVENQNGIPVITEVSRFFNKEEKISDKELERCTIVGSGDHYDVTVNFKNEGIASLVISKELSNWWRVACETMGEKISVNDPNGGNGGIHRRSRCGDPTHYRIMVDENGVPYEMWETETENMPDLKCTLYTENWGEKLPDTYLQEIQEGDLIYWDTTYNGKIWYHYGHVFGTNQKYTTTESFTFTVKDSAGNYYNQTGASSATEVTVTIHAGDEAEFYNLPAGTYTVTELNTANRYNVSITDGSNKNIAFTNTVNVTVSNGKTQITNFVNEKIYRVLAVHKAINPLDDETLATGKYYVKVTGTDYEEIKEIDLSSGNDTVIFEDLEPGYYTVKEVKKEGASYVELPQNEPYHISMAWSNNKENTGSSNDNAITVNLTQATNGSVTITNKLNKVKFRKKITQPVAEDTTFYFQIRRQAGSYIDPSVYRSFSVTIPAGKTEAEMILELPVEKHESNGHYYWYKFIETDNNGNELKQGEIYDVAVSADGIIKSDSVTFDKVFSGTGVSIDKISPFATTVVEFTNTPKGSLSIRKVLDSAESAEGKSFYAALTKIDDNVTYYYNETSKTFQTEPHGIPLNTDGAAIVISGLELGVSYEVTETNENGVAVTQNEPYHIAVEGENAATVNSDGTKAAVVFSMEKLTGEVTITNSLGKLTINKTVAGGSASDNEKSFDVTVTRVIGGTTWYYKEDSTAVSAETKLSVPAGGSVSLTGLPFGTYTVSETDDKVKDYVVSGTGTVEIDGSAEKTVTITNTKIDGKVTLTKYDGNEGAANLRGLAGVKFQLKSGDAPVKVSGSAGSYSYDESVTTTEMETDANGKIVVTGLPLGAYSFTETEALDSYVLDATAKGFTLEKGTENANVQYNGTKAYVEEEVTVYNSSFAGGLKFKKIDADSETADTGLGGVSFELYKKGTNNQYSPYGSYDIVSNTTDKGETGWVYIYGLPKGDYYLKEVADKDGLSTAAGYLATTEELYFSITEENKCESDETEKYVTLTVPDNNENSAVSEGTDGARVANHRVKGVLNIEKQGSSEYSGNVLLSGVEFTLTKNGAEIKVSESSAGQYAYTTSGTNTTLTTDGNGKIQVTGLPWGEYTLTETAPKTGYTLCGNTTFKIGNQTDEALTVSYTPEGRGAIVNTPVKGEVLLEKFDQTTGASLNGAEFNLYHGDYSKLSSAQKTALMANEAIESTDFVKVNTAALVVTDGKLDKTVFAKLGELEYGKYFFVETKAPNGFEREENPFYSFEIDGTPDSDKAEADAYVSVNNKEMKGRVTLYKADADKDGETITRNALNGAKFELYAKKRNTEETTWIEKLASWANEVFGGTGYLKETTIEYVVTNGVLGLKDPVSNVTLNEDGSVTISNLDWGEYYFVEQNAPDGYVTPETKEAVAHFQIGIDSNGNYIDDEKFDVSRTISNDEDVLGKVEFTKVDEEDNEVRLSGAEFELYYSDGTPIYEPYDETVYTSEKDDRVLKIFRPDSTGKVSAENLPWGKYYFLETKAPAGYELPVDENGDPNKKIEFTVDGTNAGASETLKLSDVTNKKVYGDLELYKVDGTAHTDDEGNAIAAKPLEGATFYLVEVTDLENNTEKNVEVSAVSGSQGEYKFVKSDGNRTEMAADGTADEENGGKQNRLYVSDLPGGTYRIYEKEAPEGYKVNDKKYVQFTVKDRTGDKLKEGTANHYIHVLTFENSDVQANIRFVKVSENTERLGGVKFYLYKYHYAAEDEEGETDTELSETRSVVKTLMGEYNSASTRTIGGTDIGEVIVYGLGEGLYYFVEDTESADDLGYVSDTTKHTFKVTQNDAGKFVEFDNPSKLEGQFDGYQVINNNKKKGSVSFSKKGADGNGLAGVTFKLYKEGQENAVDTLVTTEDNGGMLSSGNLDWGDYYLVETEAPAQYKLPDPTDASNWIRFTIPETTSGSTKVEVDITLADIENTLVKGEAKLIKVDKEDTASKLQYAHFALYDAATGEIAEHPAGYTGSVNYADLVTNSQGEILTEKDLSYGEYYFVETVAPTGYEKSNEKIYFTIDRDHTTADEVARTFRDHQLAENETVPTDGSNIISNERLKGRYGLYKYEEKTVNGTTVEVGIPNVTFTLYKKSNGIFKPYREERNDKTSYNAEDAAKNGFLEFTELEWGDYKVVETIPDGYKLPEGVKDEFEFTIDATHLYLDNVSLASPQKKIKNERETGKIKLYKVEKNSTEKRGQLGATFELYRYVDGTKERDVKIGTYSLPSDGNTRGELEITSNELLWGERYYFVETASPNGYAPLDNTTVTKTWVRQDSTDPETAEGVSNENGRTPLITLDPASANKNAIQIVRIENRKLTRQDVTLTKTADETENNIPLAGATFNLYRVTKNAGGTITSRELIYATKDSDGVYTYADQSTNGSVSLLSVGAESEQLGKLTVKDLTEGSYVFDEVSAPAGYLVAESDTGFKIEYYDSAEKNPVEKTVTAINSKVRAGVEFTKYSLVDGVETPLGGVAFALYRYVEGGEDELLDEELIYSRMTADGTETIGKVSYSGLGVGKYYFKEISTPKNAYNLGGPYYFHIDAADDKQVVGLDNNNTSWTRIESDAGKKVVNTPSTNGSVSLVKYERINGVDQTTPIQGAVFELYRVKQGKETEDQKIGEYTTDTNGQIEESGLVWGSYYFVEKSVPGDADVDGAYVISESSKKIDFTIPTETSMDETLTVYNERKYGSVSIHKTGKNGADLKGVTFKLYKGEIKDDAEHLIETLTTDDKGKASYGFKEDEKKLEWGGHYILVETKTAEGYALKENKKEFDVTKDHLTFSYEIENEMIQGKVKLFKKDAKTGAGIPNVTFKLYSYTTKEDGTRDTKEVTGYTYTTGNDGYLYQIDSGDNRTNEIGPLDYGKYYFIETETPDNYQPLTDTIDFEITSRTTVELTGDDSVVNTPKLGSVRIHKAGDNGEALNGAKFKLYRTDGATSLREMWQTLTAGGYQVSTGYYETGYLKEGVEIEGVNNDGGWIIINDLPIGNYKLEEIQAARGYELEKVDGKNRTYTFEITETNVTSTIDIKEITNKQLKGSVRLTKVDGSDSETTLDGAAFKLYQVGESGPKDVTLDYKDKASGYFSSDKEAFVTVNGKIELLNVLEWGTYYFEETEAPEGYVFETGKKSESFTIGSDDDVNGIMKVHLRTVSNDKIYGYLGLKKELSAIDDNVNALTDLSGMTFRLIDESTGEEVEVLDGDGNKVTLTTNPAGIIKPETIGRLPYGTYHFEETGISEEAKAAGYKEENLPVSTSITISSNVTDPAQATYTTVINYAVSGRAHIDKVDKDGHKIPGIDFKLYRLSEEAEAVPTVYRIVTSTVDGVDFTDIPKGSYYFTEDAESAARLGYKADTTHYYFDITEQSQNAEVYKKVTVEGTSEVRTETVSSIENEEIEKGKISLKKYVETDKGTRRADISKASFVLRDANADDHLVVYDADYLREHIVNNEIVVEVPRGSYYFEETVPVPGYAINGLGRTEAVTIGAGNIAASLAAPIERSLTNKKIKVYFSKRDKNNKVIEGKDAVIELYKAGYTKGSTPLRSWNINGNDNFLLTISDNVNDAGAFVEGFVAGESYALHEASAPEGYKTAADVVFTVNDNGTITLAAGSKADLTTFNTSYQEILMKDDDASLTISKRRMAEDEAARTRIPGGIGGELVLLKYNESTSRVLSDPENVSLDSISADDIVQRFAIDGDDHTFNNIKVGAENKYILWETSAPKGYYTADPIVFYLDGDSKIQVEDSDHVDPHMLGLGTQTLQLLDRPIEYKLNKLITGTGKYVTGAVLKLYEKKENGEEEFIYSFTTTGTEDIIPAGYLEAGKTYVIREVSVPEGYVKPITQTLVSDQDDAEPKLGEFTVARFDSSIKLDSNGVMPQDTTVYNDLVKLLVSKQSEGTQLAGAKLKIVDNEGGSILYNTADEIVTGDKPLLLIGIPVTELSTEELNALAAANNAEQVLGARLIRGETYQIIETEAPAGYALAAPVSFRLNEDGAVYIGDNAVNEAIMTDKALAIAFDKKDYSGHSVIGAQMQLKDGDSVIAEWETNGKPVMISESGTAKSNLNYRSVELIGNAKLVSGKTYTLHEVSAPSGYETAPDKTVTISDSDVVNANGDPVTITMLDNHPETDETSLVVEKQWIVPENGEDFEYPEVIYIDVTRKIKNSSETATVYKTLEVSRAEIKRRLASDGETVFAFEHLPLYDGNGNQYEYDAKERLAEGVDTYITSYGTADRTNKVVIINTLKSWPDTEISALKRWVLYKDEDGRLVTDPVTTVTLELYRWLDSEGKDQGAVVASKRIEKGDLDSFGEYGFKFSETDDGKKLPKYNTSTGELYKYEVREAKQDGFTPVITQPVSGSIYDFIVTNTPDNETFNIRGHKNWLKVPGDQETKLPVIRMDLYRDGKYLKSEYLDDRMDFNFTELPRYSVAYDQNGKLDVNLYEYTLKEVNDKSGVEIRNEDRFTVTIEPETFKATGEDENLAVTVSNTWRNEYIDIRGNKNWISQYIGEDGTKNAFPTDYTTRPVVYIDLYQAETDTAGNLVLNSDGTPKLTAVLDTDGKQVSETINRFQNGYLFENLPKYDLSGEVAREIVYVVKERAAAGYASAPSEGYSTVYTADGIAYRRISAPDAEPTNTADFTNTPSLLKISKVDVTGTAEIAGAVLELTDKDGRVVDTWTSDGTPHYVSAVVPGETYTLTELLAPRGYWLAKEAVIDGQTVTVSEVKATGTYKTRAAVSFKISDIQASEDGTATLAQTVKLKDEEIIGKLTVKKVDKDEPETMLNGAKFKVYTSAGAPVKGIKYNASGKTYTYSTDAEASDVFETVNGQFELENLPYGTYRIEETEAPAMYELTTMTRDELTFSISDAESDVTKTVTDTKKTGTAILVKKAKDAEGKLLPGAEFELWSDRPTSSVQAVGGTLIENPTYLVGRYTTDDKGEIKVEGLPWGKYWFIESKAPAGYGYEADPVTKEQRAYGFDVPSADGSFEIPVNVIDPPAPDVTPTPTRRPTDEPEETPTPTPTDEPTPTPGVTDTPIPTEVVVVVVTETPTSTPTPTTGVTATPTPTRAVAAAMVTPTPTAAVLGARRTKPGDVVSGVLGVRSAPTEGVLGARIGPTTGDAANIALWLIILAASIGAIVLILAQNSKRKKNVK